jgi:asparagine synthase (glutamine-hydrolysing)
MCGLVVYQGKQSDFPEFQQSIHLLVHRGPDHYQMHEEQHVVFAFHRLAIMDLTGHGNQPFLDARNHNMAVCNGEIYNFETLRKALEISTDYVFHSHSDCEVILPLYKQHGLKGCIQRLDGEFACVIYDNEKQQLYAARDPMGIRPLFYGYSKLDQSILFASEMKGIDKLCEEIKPFPPGHYYDGSSFIPYIEVWRSHDHPFKQMDEVLTGIKDKLISAVEKRLHADAHVGFLLSGGLDSSLVCSIAHRLSKGKRLKTFAIGMDENPIDLKYAQEVADFIGSDHHSVIMTKKDVIDVVKKVIWHLETWDITTIRASIGMYLCCQYIHQHTPIKVLLTGEVADELFGYKYTDFAPSAAAFQEEAVKRIKELYLYDVLRADRCIAANSLEARVPFSDTAFVEFVMNIDPALKMNHHGMGKYLLRKAFDDDTHWLPESILYREKAAFSDAVGHSMVDDLKAHAAALYSDQDLQDAREKHPFSTPFSKESLWYRDIFESFYPGRAELIPDFWMPNKSWPHCDVADPSARVLKNYGHSGK